MRRCKWCLGLLSSLFLSTGCVSTLPPSVSTYSFDRRCLSGASDVRSVPVSQNERRQELNDTVEKDAAVQLYSPIGVHIADVTGLLPLLNRMARLELQPEALSDIERGLGYLLIQARVDAREVSNRALVGYAVRDVPGPSHH
jgi:hypothetical protein